MSNITPEQQERIDEYNKLLKEASEKTQITTVAKIGPDGPHFQYADLKTNPKLHQDKTSGDNGDEDKGGDNPAERKR